MKYLISILLLVLAAGVWSKTSEQSEQDDQSESEIKQTYWYVSLGFSYYSETNNELFVDTGRGFKVGVGYQPHKNFSFEINWDRAPSLDSTLFIKGIDNEAELELGSYTIDNFSSSYLGVYGAYNYPVRKDKVFFVAKAGYTQFSFKSRIIDTNDGESYETTSRFESNEPALSLGLMFLSPKKHRLSSRATEIDLTKRFGDNGSLSINLTQRY